MKRPAAIVATGLTILVAVMPFHAFLSVWLGHLTGHQLLWQSWKEVVIVIIGLAATVDIWRTHSTRQRLASPFIWLIGAFSVVALVVTAVTRPSLAAAAYGFKTDLEFLAVFGLGLIFGSRWLGRRLERIILITGLIVSVIALLLAYVLPPDWLTQFGYGPATILPFERVDPAVRAIRTPSTLGGPNQLGAFLILPLAIAISRLRTIRSWPWGLAVLVISGGIWVSYSRAALLGAAVAGLVIIGQRLNRRQRIIVSLSVVVIVAGLAGLALSSANRASKLQYYVLHQQAHGSNTSASTSQHLAAFSKGVGEIVAQPLGRGLGSAGPASFHSADPFIPESFYLQIGIETGLIGLGLFVALLIFIARPLISLSPADRTAGALLGALAGLATTNLVLHGWADTSTALVFWSLLGVYLAEPPWPSRDRRLAGIRVDDVDLAGSIDRVKQFVASGQPHQIITLNSEFIVAAHRQPAFAQTIESASLVIPDGSGVVLLGQLVGPRLSGWVSGVDLAEAIMAEAAASGWRIFLLGGAPGVADEAAAIWRHRYPALTIAGTNAGSMSSENAAAIAAAIKRRRPDIVMVAFRFPRQDQWIAENLAATGAKVGIGLGGTFNYVAGRLPRAPRWMRRLGLEWLFRLLSQPSRARRMLALPKLVGLILWRGKGFAYYTRNDVT